MPRCLARALRRHPSAVLLAGVLAALASSCGHSPSSAYLATEAGFLRPGVDRESERREVVRTLEQRKLKVYDEVQSLGYVAIAARSADGVHTAVRVITSRGVLLAEDGALDDPLGATRVQLARVPQQVGELELVGLVRIARGQDRGCLELYRVFADGTTLPVNLDASALGSEACVVAAERALAGRLLAEVGWPRLALGIVPHLNVVLSFGATRLDQAAPASQTARIDTGSEQLERERAALDAVAAAGLPFAERHALALARAGLSLLSGESADKQAGTYRAVVGGLPAEGPDADLAQRTLEHIANGWLEGEAAPPEPP